MSDAILKPEHHAVQVWLSLTDLRDIAKALDHRLDALADAGTYRGHALRSTVRQTRERVASLAAQISLHIQTLEAANA